MSAAHTPGPLKVERDPATYDATMQIYSVESERLTARAIYNAADAVLYSAVPALLEVAEKLVEAIEWDRHEARPVGEIEAAWKAVEAAARAAIARATGEQQ